MAAVVINDSVVWILLLILLILAIVAVAKRV